MGRIFLSARACFSFSSFLTSFSSLSSSSNIFYIFPFPITSLSTNATTTISSSSSSSFHCTSVSILTNFCCSSARVRNSVYASVRVSGSSWRNVWRISVPETDVSRRRRRKRRKRRRKRRRKKKGKKKKKENEEEEEEEEEEREEKRQQQVCSRVFKQKVWRRKNKK